MNLSLVERKLAAILSADVVGYSRLMRHDEPATVATLREYREVFTEAIEDHRGRVVDAKGDAILAEFPSVVTAVACAVVVQEELARRNEELASERKMRFRIGVNLGDVIVEDDAIYGDGVNIAARLESLAEPGGVWIARNAFDQVDGKIPVRFEYTGEHMVKNIDTPVRAYKVLLDGKGTEAPAAAAEEAATPKAKPALELPERPSIAVLPFENMSGDAEQEYFADGITDDIITDLSKLRGLFVIARNSVFTYKGKPVDVRQVGSELGVRYVLEGSVRKAAQLLRINVQLIDCTTREHLWAQRFDRELKDIFVLQDEIARCVVEALDVQLVSGEQSRTWRKTTDNPEAYDYFLRGIAFLGTISRDGVQRARDNFSRALELDPNFTMAIINLAITYVIEADAAFSQSPPEDYKRAEELALRAQELDPQLGDVQTLLGVIQFSYHGDHRKGIAAMEKGVELSPNSSHSAVLLASFLTCCGRAEEALPMVQRAIRLNPFPPDWYLNVLGGAYLWTGQFDRAIEVYEECLAKASEFAFSHVSLALAYIGKGREADARRQIKEVLRISPRFTAENFLRYFNDPDTVDKVKDWLRQAGLE